MLKELSEYKIDARLHLAGSYQNDSILSDCRTYIAANGLSEKVIFHGVLPQKELAALIAKAHINISASFIIRTILEINMKSKNHLLTTSLLSKEIGSINGENLAYLIENNKIKEIISLIKRRGENNLVMGCTHYSLIKKIFEGYFSNIESNEYELIKNLPSTTLAINLYASIDTIKKINVFFPNLVIKEMDH